MLQRWSMIMLIDNKNLKLIIFANNNNNMDVLLLLPKIIVVYNNHHHRKRWQYDDISYCYFTFRYYSGSQRRHCWNYCRKQGYCKACKVCKRLGACQCEEGLLILKSGSKVICRTKTLSKTCIIGYLLAQLVKTRSKSDIIDDDLLYKKEYLNINNDGLWKFITPDPEGRTFSYLNLSNIQYLWKCKYKRACLIKGGVLIWPIVFMVLAGIYLLLIYTQIVLLLTQNLHYQEVIPII